MHSGPTVGLTIDEGTQVEMTTIAHHTGEPQSDPSRGVAAIKAVLTLVLVTLFVAGALGAATWVAARLLVHLLP